MQYESDCSSDYTVTDEIEHQKIFEFTSGPQLEYHMLQSFSNRLWTNIRTLHLGFKLSVSFSVKLLQNKSFICSWATQLMTGCYSFIFLLMIKSLRYCFLNCFSSHPPFQGVGPGKGKDEIRSERPFFGICTLMRKHFCLTSSGIHFCFQPCNSTIEDIFRQEWKKEGAKKLEMVANVLAKWINLWMAL